MLLPCYEFTCTCGHIFKGFELNEFSYGEFLLRNGLDEVRYLNAIESETFAEISRLVKENIMISSLEDIEKSTIVQTVFSVACDRSIDNSLFVIDRFPMCPKCKGHEMEDWQQLDDDIEVDISPVTHIEWNKLSQKEKEYKVNESIEEFLNKYGNYYDPS